MFNNKDFMLLLIGRFITNFGDSVYLIATMTLVYSLTGSTYYTGIALFLTSSMAIFQVLLSPIIDRINMKKFLIITQLVQGALILLFPYLHITGRLHVNHVLIIMPIISLINQLVYPSQLSLLPKIVDASDLVKANSLFSIAYQGSDAVFNAISGFIISIMGFMIAYYIDSVTFFLNALLFVFLSKNINNFCSDKKITVANHISNLKKGLEIWRKPILKSLLIGVIVINFSATAIFATLPEFSSNYAYYGILLSASGIGVLLGALLANVKLLQKQKIGKVYTYFIFLTALCWFAMSIMPMTSIISRSIIFLCFLLGWILIGVLNIYSQTIVQTVVPLDKVGVALSSMIGLSVAMAPFGALSAGYLSRYYPSNNIMMYAASLILCIAIYWFFNKHMNQLTTLETIGDIE